MPPEVGEYDPATALWGGADGLDAIRVIEGAARRLLRPGGQLAVEHGAPQGAAVYWVFAEETRLARDPQPQGSGRAGPVRERDAAMTAGDGARALPAACLASWRRPDPWQDERP